MKRLREVLVILLSVMVVLVYTVVAQSGVRYSKHDFSVTGEGAWEFSNDNDEVCVYCHTPHASLGQQTPLWNKPLDNASVTFTMYSSPTMDATVPSQPSIYTLLCLSCHDGVSAVNTVLNAPGSGSPPLNPVNNSFTRICEGGQFAKWVNIGDTFNCTDTNINLANDHPVSISYQEAYNGGGLNPNPEQTSNLVLYNGKVECPTCHDPHNGTKLGGVEFMRMSNQGSQMCLVCHIK